MSKTMTGNRTVLPHILDELHFRIKISDITEPSDVSRKDYEECPFFLIVCREWSEKIR